MTNRGSKLDHAMCSLERTEAALERARGTVAEPDWAEAVERAQSRVMILMHDGNDAGEG